MNIEEARKIAQAVEDARESYIWVYEDGVAAGLQKAFPEFIWDYDEREHEPSFQVRESGAD